MSIADDEIVDMTSAIMAVAQSLHSIAQDDRAAVQRVFDQLTRQIERAKLSSWGSTVAVTAMFAAAIVAQDCRRIEEKARQEGSDAKRAAFVGASAFATLLQQYVQEFMERVPEDGITH